MTKKLRWWQFRLRTMMIFMVLVSGLLGMFAHYYLAAERQREAVATIRNLEGKVEYGAPYNRETSTWEKRKEGKSDTEQWLQDLLGIDFFEPVNQIQITLEESKPKKTIVFLEALSKIKNIKNVQVVIEFYCKSVSKPSKSSAELLANNEYFKKADSILYSINGYYLDFKVTDYGDRILKNLTSHPNIYSFEIEHFPFSDQGASYLQRLTKVKKLDLKNQYHLTNKTIKHLNNLTQLEELNLSGTAITDAGLVYLKNLTKLQLLYLRQTKITGSGLHHLTGLKEICYLDLSRTLITDKYLVHLKSMDCLWVLDLSGTFYSLTERESKSLIGSSTHWDYDQDDWGTLTAYQEQIKEGDISYANYIKTFAIEDINANQQLSEEERTELKKAFNAGVDHKIINSNIDGSGLKHLSALTELSVLYLRNTNAGDQAMLHLKNFDKFQPEPEVEDSDNGEDQDESLDDEEFSAEGEDVFLGYSYLLDLKNTMVTDKGLQHISVIKGMSLLNLRGTKITNQGLHHLKNFQQLDNLSLEETTIDDHGLTEVFKLKTLTELNLRKTNVGNLHLKNISNLSDLERLRLDYTKVTDQAMIEVAQLSNLGELFLANTQITDVGLKHLAKISRYFDLFLENTKVTAKGINILKTQIPDIYIDID